MLDPMAFFCPGTSHFGKKKFNGDSRHQKSKNDMIKKQSLSSNNLLSLSSGSDLSRRESFQRMVVIQEYLPKDRTGVTVHRGQTVELLGGDREWLFVKNDRGEEGYIPRSHCVYPYAASKPERDGEMDSRPPKSSKSFSGTHGGSSSLDRATTPNGILGNHRGHVLSPCRPSPQLQRNTNNTNNTAETTSIPVSLSQSPASAPNNTFDVTIVNGKRFSDQSSSTGTFDASDSGADEPMTSSPGNSVVRGNLADDGFVSNALKTKMASESDLLRIDRPLPVVPGKNPPIHVYSRIEDFEKANENPYSNPVDAIAPGVNETSSSRRHHGSANDIHQQKQRESTPEWKPPLPSRKPTQDSSQQRLSNGSNTGSLKSMSGSTDGSCYTEHQQHHHRNSTENQNSKLQKFRKFIWGVYVIQQEFEAVDENEISVQVGQHVSLLNQDDPDWYWVVRHDDSQEGFVPRAFVTELMHVEQPYSAVTGKPIVNGIRHISSDNRVHWNINNVDGGRVTPIIVNPDGKLPPRFAKSPSSPVTKVPHGGAIRKHGRHPVNDVSMSSALPTYSDKDMTSQGALKRLKDEAQRIPMRKCESVPTKKEMQPAELKAKSPESHGSSAHSESGEGSIVGTLV